MLQIFQNVKIIMLAFVFLLVFSPADTFANEIPSCDTASYFRVIWGLLVVLGIILVLYGIVRKRFPLLATSPSKHIFF